MTSVCIAAYPVSSGATSATTAAQAGGAYSLTGLAAGQYKVQFYSCGPNAVVAPQWWQSQTDFSTATVITLASGASQTGISATMGPGATISGTVTVPAGQTVTGVCVYAYDASSGASSIGTVVGSGGTYSLVVSPGSFRVQFFSCNSNAIVAPQWWQNKTDYSSADLVTLVAGGSQSNVNATMAAGATISGTVTVPAGQSPTGVCIYASPVSSGASGAGAQAGSGGTYSIVVSAGTFEVEFYACGGNRANVITQWWNNQPTSSTATPITLAANGTQSGISATMAGGATISGTVNVPSGQSATGVCVSAVPVSGSASGANTNPVADGTYTLVGLGAGQYKVEFASCGANVVQQWWQNAPDYSSATVITLAAGGSQTGISATMVLGATISGTVTVPAGQDPTHVCVSGLPLGSGNGIGASPAANGNYSLTGLTPGQYKVEFASCGANVVQQWWQNAPDYSSATVITLAAGGSQTGISATMVLGATISGTVTVPAGQDPTHVCVQANRVSSGNGASTTPAASGAYTINGLAAGQYTVEFVSCGANVVTQWWNNQPTSASANVITLASGATQNGVNATMHPSPPPADFAGNGVTDRSVYRPSTGQWFTQGASPEVTQYGSSGDVPVPANYLSFTVTLRAIYRPSTGQWFISGASPEMTQYGVSGDIPVPADYDNVGHAQIAIYRPSTGQWFVHNSAVAEVTQYGQPGDIPVPGDYDGVGHAQMAIYRPSTGQWFVRNSAVAEVTQYGVSGDVPVPGDYDGVNHLEKAIYRPSTGQWIVRGGATEVIQYGSSGDIPEPGVYDGGNFQRAIYRPSTGQWIVQNSANEAIQYGISGDEALPLPYGVRQAFGY